MMQLEVKKYGIILQKTNHSFENEAVFNPAIMQDGDDVHLFYRAVRKGNFSTIGYAKLEGPLKVVERKKRPILFPEISEEFQGLEDPRITKIDSTYYLTYSAFDGINVFGALATSKNLKQFEKKGIITPKFTHEKFAELIRENLDKISDKHLLFSDLFDKYHLKAIVKTKLFVWDKNVVFFPRKINGKIAFLHRFFPSIQIVYYNELKDLTKEFWRLYVTNLRDYIVLHPSFHYERSHVGAGCPPIETADGWLLIYHAAQATVDGLVYHAAAALLHLEDPTKVLGHLKKPLFCPTEDWEREGTVPNVVFPTGTAQFKDDLYIYYGAADTSVAVASVNIKELVTTLKNSEDEISHDIK